MARRPPASEFDRALAMALRRLRSGERFEAEIMLTLDGSGFSESVRDQVLDRLRKQGIVSDKRAIEAHLAKRSGKRAVGMKRLRLELLRRGAPEHLVGPALGLGSNDLDQAIQVLVKRFPVGADRAKIGRFLYGRGFDEEIIEQALDQFCKGDPLVS